MRAVLLSVERVAGVERERVAGVERERVAGVERQEWDPW